jgi:hypothetical protein
VRDFGLPECAVLQTTLPRFDVVRLLLMHMLLLLHVLLLLTCMLLLMCGMC